jgi:hypothetical protein
LGDVFNPQPVFKTRIMEKANVLTLNDFLTQLIEQNFSLSLELLVFHVHQMHLTQELLIETVQAYFKMKKQNKT